MSDAYLAKQDTVNVETGKMNFVDAEDVGDQIGTGSGTVGRLMRERMQIGGATRAAVAAVANSAPSSGDYGLVVRQVGTGTTDTELPAAAVLADDTANPTAPAVASFGHVFDGTTWDRHRGDTANGADVDVTRVIPGPGATHLGKAVDAAAATAETGVMLLGVRNTTSAPLTTGEAKYSPFAADAAGAIYTRGTSNTITGTGAALNATPIASSDVLGYGYAEIAITGTFVGTATFECSNDDTNWFALNTIKTTDREPYSATTQIGMFTGPVTGRYIRVRISAYTSGTVSATAIFLAVSNVVPAIEVFGSVANSVTDTGNPVKIGGVAYPAASPQTFSAGNGRRVNSWYDLSGRAATFTEGNIAHDAVDAGAPIKVGYKARTTNPTAVADLDRVDGAADKTGKQIVVPHGVRELVAQASTVIAGSATETTILAAGAAGVFHDLLLLTISNQSATAEVVSIRDTTGGTVRMVLAIGALGSNSTVTIPFSAPMAQTTAALNWTAQCSAGVATINIFVQAIKNV